MAKISGPSPEISNYLEEMKNSIINSNWDEALKLSNLIFDVDQNNVGDVTVRYAHL